MLRKSSIRTVLILIGSLLILTLAGCAPSFRKFKQVSEVSAGFVQYRISGSGNAAVETEYLLDTLLYDRKLNGGISAQVIGNSQFIIVPTYNKRLYFLNPKDGSEMTSLVAESAVGSAAAFAGELLYFAEESGGDKVVCFNLVSGKSVWSVVLQDPLGAPILSGDQLFVTSRGGRVLSINRWTGEVVWTHELQGQIYVAPAVDSLRVVFGTDRGDIIALNREDGEKLWSYHTGGAIFAQALLTDRVYCGSADGTMYALELSNGGLVWKYETAVAIHTTPVQFKDRVVFGGDDKMVNCLNADDGSVMWSYLTTGIIQSSPIALGSTFVVANSAGVVYQFSLEGRPLKQFSVGQSIEAAPAFIDGRLFVGTVRRHLFAFSAIPITATSP